METERDYLNDLEDYLRVGEKKREGYLKLVMSEEFPTIPDTTATLDVGLIGRIRSKTERLLLSSSNFDSTIIDGVTATENLVFANNFTNQNDITGYEIDTYSILNDNVLTFNLPEITSVNDVELTFVPYNTAGYDDTNKTNESQTFSGFNTFILIKGSE